MLLPRLLAHNLCRGLLIRHLDPLQAVAAEATDAAMVSDMPRTPDPEDRTISRRKWNEQVGQWKSALRAFGEKAAAEGSFTPAAKEDEHDHDDHRGPDGHEAEEQAACEKAECEAAERKKAERANAETEEQEKDEGEAVENMLKIGEASRGSVAGGGNESIEKAVRDWWAKRKREKAPIAVYVAGGELETGGGEGDAERRDGEGDESGIMTAELKHTLRNWWAKRVNAQK